MSDDRSIESMLPTVREIEFTEEERMFFAMSLDAIRRAVAEAGKTPATRHQIPCTVDLYDTANMLEALADGGCVTQIDNDGQVERLRRLLSGA